MKPVEPPPGYRATRINGAAVVARDDMMAPIEEALTHGTLYQYAARHPAARALRGRMTAYAAPLPGSRAWVVVRHSRHGGLFAPITGDRFLAPTRAPRELATALRLASLGVPTPPLVAFAIYRAGPWLRRSDVVTSEIGGGADLGTILSGSPDSVGRPDALSATLVLLRTLARTGVHHPDLNLRNILVAPNGRGGAVAYLLDVDRVRFTVQPGRAASANSARLGRSVRRWRERNGAPITAGELAALENAALGRPA